jgi:Cellulose binding domain
LGVPVVAAGAVFAVLAAGAAGLALADTAVAAAGGLTVSIATDKTWDGGWSDTATVTNDTGAAVTAWTVQLTLAAGEGITSVSRVVESSSGSRYTLTPLGYDAGIASGASTTFKIEGTDAGSYTAPTNVTISGSGLGIPTASASATGSPTSSPTATATPTAPPTSGSAKFTQADINSAVAAPLIAFAAPTAAVPRPGTNPIELDEGNALYYLALVDLQDPGAKAASGTTVDTALRAQVANLVAGGNEPDADGGLEGWSAAPVAAALLLLKHGPAWGELSAAEQNKVSLLEAAMGYGGNYAYNDANDFSSGICGYGNFSKTNNPNYEDGYVDVELAAIQFFGPSTWDSMLAGFSDAAEVSALDAAGLTNAGGCFATVGTAADKAIEPAFVWKKIPATDEIGIWNQLAADTFSLTVTSSVSGTSNGVSVTAHIADNSTSPEQGKLGMGKEFDADDSGGLRSSALYVYEGWMNVTGSRVALTQLGSFTCAAASSAAQYNVGSLDLIYKLGHGYVSYAQSQVGVLVDDIGDPSTDGPAAKGWNWVDDAYNVDVATQGC